MSTKPCSVQINCIKYWFCNNSKHGKHINITKDHSEEKDHSCVIEVITKDHSESEGFKYLCKQLISSSELDEQICPAIHFPFDLWTNCYTLHTIIYAI